MKATTISALAGLVLAGGLALSQQAQAADGVWIFNQTNAALKPCFKASKNAPWVDFGQVGENFTWPDFRSLAVNLLGSTPSGTATLYFTWVPASAGACPASDASHVEARSFRLDGTQDVYIVVEGSKHIVLFRGQDDVEED